MALNIQNQTSALLPAILTAVNGLRASLTANLTTYPHADTSSLATTGGFDAPAAAALAVGLPSATTLATTSAIANRLKKYLNIHFADTTAHKAADTVNVISTADSTASSQTSVDTLLNAIYTAVGAHLTQTGVHYTNDTTNAPSSSSATDLSTSETRANDLVTAVNAHIAFALPGASINLLPA